MPINCIIDRSSSDETEEYQAPVSFADRMVAKNIVIISATTTTGCSALLPPPKDILRASSAGQLLMQVRHALHSAERITRFVETGSCDGQRAEHCPH